MGVWTGKRDTPDCIWKQFTIFLVNFLAFLKVLPLLAKIQKNKTKPYKTIQNYKNSKLHYCSHWVLQDTPRFISTHLSIPFSPADQWTTTALTKWYYSNLLSRMVFFPGKFSQEQKWAAFQCTWCTASVIVSFDWVMSPSFLCYWRTWEAAKSHRKSQNDVPTHEALKIEKM